MAQSIGGLYEFYDRQAMYHLRASPKTLIQKKPIGENHLHYVCDFGLDCRVTIAMLQETFC
jgi:hypothetical protein